MESNSSPGKTAPAPVRVLKPIEFDFAHGQPLASDLGKTHVPVRMLSALSGELVPPPEVTVSLWVRPDATPAAVGADLFAVWKALDGYDRSWNGAGLQPGEVRNKRTADGEVIQLILAVAGPGAVERLMRLRDAVNGEIGGDVQWAGRSFLKWSAADSAA